jgi:spermidine synthase
MTRRVELAPYALFLFSGVAALVLEVVFLRELAWLFGNSAAATALVLAAFMAGLALGAALFGRMADRTARPLRLFGLLELGTAASGATLAWLLSSGRELFLGPLRALEHGPGQRAAGFLLAFTLVLVPTVLMGGTLPALSRVVIRSMSRFVGGLGLLYGVNTLGAAAGVFLAGFYLLELAGVSRSAYLAALVQVAVGLTALGLDRAAESTRRRPASPPETTPASDSPPERAAAVRRWACLIAACVGGLAVLGYEVVWTRLLSLFMRSFSYSFSLMLALFLVGLCIGAVLLTVFARWVKDPARALGWIQIGMGAWVASTLLWLPGLMAPVPASSFTDFLFRSALRAAPVVLPPTILSGMALPLAARGFSLRGSRLGTDIGLVYGLNTLGAVAGALVAGLVLLPTVGAPAALSLLAAVNALAGTLVLLLATRSPVRTVVAVCVAAACLLPLAGGGERFVNAFLAASRGSETFGDLLFFHEGATDTIAIVRRTYGFRDPEAKSLVTNGVAMSATVKPVWRYMAAEGHLPVLFCASPEKALVLGVGTGITLGAVVSHPSLRSITAAELSEGVVRGLPYFAGENERAYEDPRVTLLREDGRHFLALTRERFDLITLEPPPPIVAGSVHLYTRDFYRLCLDRLEPGGVVAQWLPLHAQSLASARMTARTFLDVFPHATLWLPSVRDAVLIGSAHPLRLDLERVEKAYGQEETRENLSRAYLETPETLLATYLLDREGIATWAGDAPVITDEHPWMEFFRHQGGNMADQDIRGLLDVRQAAWTWLEGLPKRPGMRDAIEGENRALRLYAASTVERDVAAGVEAARTARGTEFFLYRMGCASAQLDYLRSGAGTGAADASAQADRCAALLP